MEAITDTLSPSRSYWRFLEQLPGRESRTRPAGSGSRGDSPPRPGQPAAVGRVLRLESNGNNVTQTGQANRIVSGCRCRARTCLECGPQMGWITRQVLLAKPPLWG